jgi:hypothetical protein
MGSCLSSCLKSSTNKKSNNSNGNGNNGNVVLSSTTNVACMVKLGAKGSQVKSKLKNETNTYTIEGHGTALGSCSLDCDTGYWEVHIGKNPKGIQIGVVRFNSKKPTSLEAPMDGKGEGVTPSWCLSDTELKEGDVVGVCWDQTDLPMLSFCLNGNLIATGSVTRIRPANDVCPAVSVEEGSSCEIVFDGNHFLKPCPSSKFTMIVCATSLI